MTVLSSNTLFLKINPFSEALPVSLNRCHNPAFSLFASLLQWHMGPMALGIFMQSFPALSLVSIRFASKTWRCVFVPCMVSVV